MVKHEKNYLMMIEPVSTKVEPDVNDEYTKMAEALIEKIEYGSGSYKGWHTCACGAKSDSERSMLQNIETNSLLVHYVKNHRSEVPMSELEKLKNLYNRYSFKEGNKDIKQKLKNNVSLK